ncbi:cupin domain-containing protein [Thermoleophilia bacterium SCSIO 60948]|nr:cupin domain-containing protein [Thermoleophilia bacterium SCSIO 60948]
MDFTYPHSIESGGGERLTFEARRHDEKGEYLEVTNVVAAGSGPPMHVHHLQEEALTVTSGTLVYEIQGEEPRTAGPGETVSFAPGVAHRFHAGAGEELRCTGYVRPPHNLEFFLGEIFASTRRNGGKRPGLFDSAWLLTRYRSEFDMAEIPAPVKRFVLPLIARLGQAVGRARRFDAAPEPVRAEPR